MEVTIIKEGVYTLVAKVVEGTETYYNLEFTLTFDKLGMITPPTPIELTPDYTMSRVLKHISELQRIINDYYKSEQFMERFKGGNKV